MRRYIGRYRGNGNGNGSTVRGESICAIAKSIEFSPCMLARVMLEQAYGWSKTTVSTLFKEVMSNATPTPRFRGCPRDANASTAAASSLSRSSVLTEDEANRLWQELRQCIEQDAYCSPLADRVRHNVGLEYEFVLMTKLRARGLVFESEDDLRY